ncbi:Carboxypeptidase regulatory-like domain-containing protein [Kibdelosporangium aridum]|uniref:Carboxypeptidase regulatory-like domain-containing protein n=1 Tax=Kibdelosporangium aridum TaxID=2030 RepID=A0A1W2FTI2_KIBAR|nr:Carboxypeptidase regulatory-like domain-containing protein [Kibdelosporangium aridum]
MIEVIFAVTTTRWGQETVGIRKSSRLLILAAALSGTLTAVPAVGHAAPALPNVGVPATMFGKYEYAAGDTATVTYVLVNTGSVDAFKVVINAGGSGEPWELDITDWGGVGPSDEGITIPAGGTVHVKLRGTVTASSANVGRVTIAYGFGGANGDADESNNIGSSQASVPGATGILTGQATHDRNGDHRVDPGEGVAGVRITVVGHFDIDRTATTFTDSDGKFLITDLPVGRYEVRVRTPDAYWHDPVTYADVRANEHGPLSLRLYPRV